MIDQYGGIVVDDDPPSNYTECGLVLQSGATAGASPFHLTVEEGAQIGIAIATLWVLVGAIKAIANRLT